MGRVADPKTHAPPHMCYRVKFDSSATKGVRINRRNPQNWGALGPAPSVGAWLTPKNTMLPQMCYSAEIGRSRSCILCTFKVHCTFGFTQAIFLEFFSIYAYTLCRRPTKFHTVTHMGRSLVFRWSPCPVPKGRGPSASQFWEFLSMYAHTH